MIKKDLDTACPYRLDPYLLRFLKWKISPKTWAEGYSWKYIAGLFVTSAKWWCRTKNIFCVYVNSWNEWTTFLYSLYFPNYCHFSERTTATTAQCTKLRNSNNACSRYHNGTSIELNDSKTCSQCNGSNSRILYLLTQRYSVSEYNVYYTWDYEIYIHCFQNTEIVIGFVLVI